MKVHQIHDFHLKDESDFVQTQQSLKHKINYHPPSLQTPSTPAQRRPRLLGAGRRAVWGVQHYRD